MKLNRLTWALLSVMTIGSLTACGGSDGKDGTNGTDGINGTNGADGVNGQNGNNGTNGADGKNGLNPQVISLTQRGTYAAGAFDESAAEIVAFDPTSQQTFVVNAQSGKIDVLSTSDISNPTLNASLNVKTDIETLLTGVTAGAANSVDVKNGLIAVALEAATKTDDGWIAFYKVADLSFITAVQVGALPDALAFTPDGSQVVVALEGEPNDDYSIDPDGEVAIIDLTWDGSNLTTNLTEIGFSDFNVGGSRHSELPDKLLLAGIGNTDGKATVASDLEPEYIAISDDNTKAYVALQENNGVAEINLSNKSITQIHALGFKNHSIPGNELDASQKDGINIKNWPVMGMYMPDTISTMTFNGQTYFLTANEGDDRQDWLDNVTDQATCEAAGYFFGDDGDGARCIDAFTAKDFYDAGNVTLVDSEGNNVNQTNGGFGEDNELRRLKFSYHTTQAMNNGTEFKQLYAYGGRSFSIFNASTGEMVFDSGSDFERITANKYGEEFNASNDENGGDDRSDNKGPEPEALTVGKINGYTYAFIGLERMGGIMVYDISNPMSAQFVQYLNNRDITADQNTVENDGAAGDFGPESIRFVTQSDSPSGKPMLIVGNEVSGTTTFYDIEVNELSAQ